MLGLFIALFSVSQVSAGGDRTISQVVGLLEDMLEKSKSDGVTDRTVYAKFKCYCDTTTKEKSDAVAEATSDIETMEAELADRRAQNTKLSQEVAKLKSDMDANEEARAEATSLREQENTDFLATEQDLETGISQLGRAIDILAAVGADQTETGDQTSDQLMAPDATAAAKEGSFMAKKGELKKLNSDMKSALRAASVLLSAPQRTKLTSFLQAPGNYNSQSGEIVGIVKEMKDTFSSNLESARAAETKAQEEFDALIAIKTKEHEDMTALWEQKKTLIGNNAEEISTTSSELETSQGLKAADEEFLAALTARCETKQKEFEKRNMLRANEEAAIAQAVSILNSDAAFGAFGKTDATSSGATGFVQLSAEKPGVRAKTYATLIKTAQKIHSTRLTKIASALRMKANPFVEVLAMIKDMISLIDKEETDDQTKKSWCEAEQSTNNANQADKETDMGTLETNINNLEISRDASTENIALATEDMRVNRESQKSETDGRKEMNAQFTENLKNCQDAKAILVKATEVLVKYYDWLHAHTAAHTYVTHSGKDSGGNNLKRLEGADTEALEEACSADPACAGFNSAGWLKSKIVEESEWYDWEGGDLSVKTFESTRTGFIQQPMEGEPDGEFSSGQGGDGNAAIEMLQFITEETQKEMDNAIENERNAQSQFETNMQALTSGEQELTDSISQYELDLATTNKQLEETHEDLKTTTEEHAAIVKYLAEIEPGCTFMITNYETRRQNREAEKTALEGAITTLEGTPAFQNAQAAEEREALGKCAGTCETEGMDHAKCQACLNDVTVFGYCAGNEGAPGCDTATATSSAAALA